MDPASSTRSDRRDHTKTHEPEDDSGPDGPVDDPEHVTASERTRELIHDLAVGLTRLGRTVDAVGEQVRKGAKETANRVRDAPTSEVARTAAGRAKGQTRQAAEAVKVKTGQAGEAAGEALAKARAVALGLFLKAEDATEHTMDRLQEMTRELGERARVARESGRDFYVEHREEILALLVTAAKVAAVVGVRRLAAPREDDEGHDGRRGRKQTARRLVDAGSVLVAVVGQIGSLLAKQPSSLPMLREMYARGEPAEQAVVGMLLGPALSSDPDHAVEVIHEFLESATSEGAADTIARRSLAPLLAEHPELADRVTPWFHAAAPFVRRAALLALARHVADRDSRFGDILAAAVVVLEDHDEEVRQAVGRLFSRAATVDPESTAKAIAAHLDAEPSSKRARAEELVSGLPDDLRRRIDAARTDRDT